MPPHRLLRIAAEARADIADLDTVRARLETHYLRLLREPSDASVLAAVALWLDHYYTASEATLGRLSTAFDGALATCDD